MPKNFVIFICGVVIVYFAGCATVPKTDNLPAYSINGVSYLPLASLCQSRGINLEYDTFTRTITLDKNAHTVNLMVDQNLAVVDGRPQNLKHPTVIFQGTAAVPYKFKDEVMDMVFDPSEKLPQGQPLRLVSPIKKIIVDAGHGGKDPGAIGRTGTREKIVTLDIAKRLSALLKSRGFEVVMTRSTDKFVTLQRRVEIANDSRADLFISIHANANRVKSINGFEVYYISPAADDARRAIEAAKTARLNLENAYFASDSLDLKAIVWNMIYTSCRAESVNAARNVCRIVNSNLGVTISGIKGANFYVLKGARMPAMLIETGYLSNTQEESKLKNSYYRQQIAEAIEEGIRRYAQELALAQGESSR